MTVLSSLEQKAAAFLGLRLRNDARGTELAPKLIAEGLLRFDGAAWSIDDTNRKLLPLAPELLDKEKLRKLHDSGHHPDAWRLLSGALKAELAEITRREERHEIPELNRASPVRLTRGKFNPSSSTPCVRDENYWKSLEKSIETAIAGGK
jgi:hypothetical protein